MKRLTTPKNYLISMDYPPDYMRYVDLGDGTIIDTTTQLMWQKLANGHKKQSWKFAMALSKKCQQGNHTDWRLPTIGELSTLIGNDSLYSSNEPLLFGAPLGQFWSSSILSTSYVKVLDFRDGKEQPCLKSKKIYSIYVRSTGTMSNRDSLIMNEKVMSNSKVSNCQSVNIFLSYAREDIAKVRKIYAALNDQGWNTWLDEEMLLPGQNWEVEIESAIESADFIIMLLSSDSVSKKGYVQKEARFAHDIWQTFPDGKVFVIPIRLDDCAIPRRLKSIHCLDMFPQFDTSKIVSIINKLAH